MPIHGFYDQGSEDIYHGIDSKLARASCPKSIWRVAQRKLDLLHAAARLIDLVSPPSNHLKALEHDRKGQHAIRINDRYRICFEWTDSGPDRVEIVDGH